MFRPPEVATHFRTRACGAGYDLTPLVIPVLRILQKLWGGPPVRAGPPWAKPPLEQMPEQKVTSLDPLFANRVSLIHNGQAGQGAGRGPGVRPTIFAGCRVMGKTSGIKVTSLAHTNVGLRADVA